jgi:hypothetical protein
VALCSEVGTSVLWKLLKITLLSSQCSPDRNRWSHCQGCQAMDEVLKAVASSLSAMPILKLLFDLMDLALMQALRGNKSLSAPSMSEKQ